MKRENPFLVILTHCPRLTVHRHLFIEVGNEELVKKIPAGRFGEPDEVADAAMFLAKNGYANNCILNLDGGLSAS